MEEKQRLLKIIESSNADTSIKDLAKTCIEKAYDLGFQEGLKRGAEIMSTTFEMLYPKKKVGA